MATHIAVESCDDVGNPLFQIHYIPVNVKVSVNYVGKIAYVAQVKCRRHQMGTRCVATVFELAVQGNFLKKVSKRQFYGRSDIPVMRN